MNEILTKADVNTYLTTSRAAVLDKLKQCIVKSENLKPMLKQALYKFVRDDVDVLDERVCFMPMCKLLENFSLKKFTNRCWVYKPHFLNEGDYNKLRHLKKVPLLIKGFNNTDEIYTFPNNINIKSSSKFEKVMAEPKFYTNEEDNIMFGKLMRLKYVPAEEKILQKLENTQGLDEYPYDDETIYDKVISISFCAIIKGDCTNAIPIYRYDSSKLHHKNIYIGDDERREIFGDVAQSPHFHFQNEDDSLLCLRKYHQNNNKDHLYKSGRCNAIDCKHLRNKGARGKARTLDSWQIQAL